MKKGRTWITFVTIVFVAIFWIVLMVGTDEWRTEKNMERERRDAKYSSWVGQKVSLRAGDTLVVIDYNKWKNVFILDDESQLTPNAVAKLRVK